MLRHPIIHLPQPNICNHCSNVYWTPPRVGRYFCSVKCRHRSRIRNRDQIAAYFWDRVRRSDGDECWIWTGQLMIRAHGNYGVMRINNRQVYAHRLAWEIEHGPIPAGKHVCHRCDNPPCCRVDHLFLDTPAGNHRDKVKKGRQPRGESHPSAKLTEQAVRTIRQRFGEGTVKQVELAREYGLTSGIVSNIVRGKTWRHLLSVPDTE